MAFSNTIDGNYLIFGNKRVAYGTFTNTAGSTGGNIDTGLKFVDSMILQERGTAVTTGRSVVNETLPGADGSAITIVTDADVDGLWEAKGDL